MYQGGGRVMPCHGTGGPVSCVLKVSCMHRIDCIAMYLEPVSC
jgi:hypothetical protein